MLVESKVERRKEEEEEKDVPRASRNRATLLSWSQGSVGSISPAISVSPLRTAVWYSMMLRERAQPQVRLSFSLSVRDLVVYMGCTREGSEVIGHHIYIIRLFSLSLKHFLWHRGP